MRMALEPITEIEESIWQAEAKQERQQLLQERELIDE